MIGFTMADKFWSRLLHHSLPSVEQQKSGEVADEIKSCYPRCKNFEFVLPGNNTRLVTPMRTAQVQYQNAFGSFQSRF